MIKYTIHYGMEGGYRDDLQEKEITSKVELISFLLGYIEFMEEEELDFQIHILGEEDGEEEVFNKRDKEVELLIHEALFRQY